MILLLSFLFTFAVGADPFLNCQVLLDGAGARAARARVLGLFSEDADLEGDDVAYVGVSSRELIELLNTGAVEAKGTRLWPRLVQGGPSFEAFVAAHRNYDYESADRATQEKLAREDAWVRTLADELSVRRPGGTVTGERLQAALRRLDQGFQKGERYSPSFVRLREVAEASALPKTGKTKWSRLRGLCQALDLPWPERLEINQAQLERDLTATFADLPAAGGVVLSFKPSVLYRIAFSARWAPHLPRVDVNDLVGLAPTTDEGYRFLEALARELVN